jgi:hypothetical protein
VLFYLFFQQDLYPLNLIHMSLLLSSPPEAFLHFLSPVLLASPIPYSLVLFFKPGAQGFVMKHKILVVNNSRLDPDAGFSAGDSFRSLHGSYLKYSKAV